jgi:hypothetical protein
MLYMVTFTINIPQMLGYIPYMDPMGLQKPWAFSMSTHPSWVPMTLEGNFHPGLVGRRGFGPFGVRVLRQMAFPFGISGTFCDFFLVDYSGL